MPVTRVFWHTKDIESFLHFRGHERLEKDGRNTKGLDGFENSPPCRPLALIVRLLDLLPGLASGPEAICLFRQRLSEVSTN